MFCSVLIPKGLIDITVNPYQQVLHTPGQLLSHRPAPHICLLLRSCKIEPDCCNLQLIRNHQTLPKIPQASTQLNQTLLKKKKSQTSKSGGKQIQFLLCDNLLIDPGTLFSYHTDASQNDVLTACLNSYWISDV